MGVTFNAFEIFEMAEQIERNGARFYQKAAQCVSNAKSKQTLAMLAEMERGHEKIFADMRKQLSEKDPELRAFDPENEMSLYLQALASGHVFDLDPPIRSLGPGRQRHVRGEVFWQPGLPEYDPSATLQTLGAALDPGSSGDAHRNPVQEHDAVLPRNHRQLLAWSWGRYPGWPGREYAGPLAVRRL